MVLDVERNMMSSRLFSGMPEWHLGYRKRECVRSAGVCVIGIDGAGVY